MTNLSQIKEKIHEHRQGIALFMGTVFTVATASATTNITTTLSPILEDVAAIFPTIVNLIIACVPAILVLSVVGFILGLFAVITGKIKL